MGFCNEWAQRAEIFARLHRPIETIASAGAAAKPLRVLEHVITVAILAGVFALGLDIGAADMKGVDFIPANPPVENFLFSCLRIEEPLTILLDERDGKGPAVRSQPQRN